MTPLLLSFLFAISILVVTPGVDTALVLRTAAVEGPGRAVQAALGVGAGCLVWGLAVALGVGALLDASPLAYDIIKWAGAGYLTWLGIRLLMRPRRALDDADAKLAASTSENARASAGTRTDTSEPAGVPASEPASARTVAAGGTRCPWFWKGLLNNVLNPKVGIFYISFLPQFVPAGADVAAYSFGLATVHVLLGLAWSGALIVATRPLGRWLRRPAVVGALDRITGGVFVGFAIRLATSQR